MSTLANPGQPVPPPGQMTTILADIRRVRASLLQPDDTSYTAELWALYEECALAIEAGDADGADELMTRIRAVSAADDEAWTARLSRGQA